MQKINKRDWKTERKPLKYLLESSYISLNTLLGQTNLFVLHISLMTDSELMKRKRSFAHKLVLRQVCSFDVDACRHLGIDTCRDIHFIRGMDPKVTVELETS